MRNWLLLALLFSLPALAQISGHMTTLGGSGDVLEINGSLDMTFTFDPTAPGPLSQSWDSALVPALSGLPGVFSANRAGYREFLKFPASEMGFKLEPAGVGHQVLVASSKPYQILVGPVSVTGPALPLENYRLIVARSTGTGFTGPAWVTLDNLTAPAVIYTGSAGGTTDYRFFVVVKVGKGNLLPDHTITIPITVVQTP